MTLAKFHKSTDAFGNERFIGKSYGCDEAFINGVFTTSELEGVILDVRSHLPKKKEYKSDVLFFVGCDNINKQASEQLGRFLNNLSSKIEELPASINISIQNYGGSPHFVADIISPVLDN